MCGTGFETILVYLLELKLEVLHKLKKKKEIP
jgi:hypothetical protein